MSTPSSVMPRVKHAQRGSFDAAAAAAAAAAAVWLWFWFSGPFYTSERRGGVERRQLELKGAEGGY